MRILGWLVVIALLLVGAFAAVNWAAFTAPTTLSLVALEVYAPLGVVMLGALLVLTVLALGFAASWRTSMLVESRRLSRDLEAQRALAERAEASRLTDLGKRLDTGLADLKAAAEAGPAGIGKRLDELDASLRDAMTAAVNSVSAAVGELEDKVDRALPVETPAGSRT